MERRLGTDPRGFGGAWVPGEREDGAKRRPQRERRRSRRLDPPEVYPATHGAAVVRQWSGDGALGRRGLALPALEAPSTLVVRLGHESLVRELLRKPVSGISAPVERIVKFGNRRPVSQRQVRLFIRGIVGFSWWGDDSLMTAESLVLTVERLVDLKRSGELPFDMYRISSSGTRVEISVGRLDYAAAMDYFDKHPVIAPDGIPISIDIRVLAASSWSSQPVGGVRDEPDASVLEGLVGVDVNEAALRANAGGWLVRAHEPDAVLTADFRPNRANLEFAESGEVTSVRVG